MASGLRCRRSITGPKPTFPSTSRLLLFEKQTVQKYLTMASVELDASRSTNYYTSMGPKKIGMRWDRELTMPTVGFWGDNKVKKLLASTTTFPRREKQIQTTRVFMVPLLHACVPSSCAFLSPCFCCLHVSIS